MAEKVITEDNTRIRGEKIIVYLGEIIQMDGEKKVRFKSFCVGNSRALQINKSFAEEEQITCNDNGNLPWTSVMPTTLAWSMNSEFAIDKDFLLTWQEAFLSSTPKIIKMVVQFPKQAIIYKGWAHIENFEIGAEKTSWVKATINFKGTGKLTIETLDKLDPKPNEDLQDVNLFPEVSADALSDDEKLKAVELSQVSRTADAVADDEKPKAVYYLRLIKSRR
ncbi:phage tail tube protein [Bartonella sp. DGB1]|uniref:phage tail tube protein n=1 Tax=Bartonella sp. DGB1 TaxID=3239807 RepID=UPI003525646B